MNAFNPYSNQKKSAHQILFYFPLILFFILMMTDLSIAQEVIPPKCCGGNRLLKEFIAEEMQYPSKSLQAQIEGVVELSFIVESNGSVSNLTFTKKVAPDIDKEAIRIFNKIIWQPATELGIPIAYLHEFSIPFKTKKYQKLIRRRGYEYFSYPHTPVDSGNRVYQRKEVDVGAYPIISSLDINLTSFLTKNLKYPESAFKQSVSGTVELIFVVEPSGRISNIQIIKALGGGCTEEAIRVVKMIRWFPALKNNIAVRSFIPMEINFNLASKTVGGSVPSPGQLN